MALLTLYSFPTPNGQTVSIFLYQLMKAYPDNEVLKNLEVVKMSIWDADIGKVHNHVKSQWYIDTINPNGRIPAIVHNGFAVFETGAILLYLADEFDIDRKFSFDPQTDKKSYSEMLQWMFFIHAGAVMHSQGIHFKSASEKIDYAINRYVNETRRLYDILNKRLENKKFVVGDKYTIADARSFPLARKTDMVGIDNAKEFPAMKSWIERCEAIPGVKEGSKVPPWN